MIDLELKQNDVLIIFRPTTSDKDVWDGSYKILISGIGPFTLSEDDIGKLVSSAMMTSACSKFLETDAELADRAYKHCEESFGDMEEATIIPTQMELFSDEHFLDEDTPTIGGMQ